MSTLWKTLVGLLLVLPLGAYITGTMMTSQADMPRERAPIVISDTPSEGAPPKAPDASSDPNESDPGSSQRPGRDKQQETEEKERPAPPPEPPATSPEEEDDDEVPLIRPTPRDVDDDGDEDDDDDEGDDDDEDSDDD